jgi:hypothetical protein
MIYIDTMSMKKRIKLNQLLSTLPPGIVVSSSWLTAQGYSLGLQQRYKKSSWFDSIGSGAMVRHGDEVDYLGGIYTLQSQLGLSVHPAGKTALSLQGKAHYLELSAEKAHLFAGKDETVPRWFKKRDWGLSAECKQTNFLPPELGLVEIDHKNFKVKVSSPARAIMECLYLAPRLQPLMEVYELVQGLNNLRPTTVQKLLESCRSIKVKRLFLYLADKAGHEWFSYIKQDAVDLGAGKRAIVKEGVYVTKYRITVPKELEATV